MVMDRKIVEQRINRIDTILKSAYTIVLCIAAAMFVYAVKVGGVEGEAHIGTFEAQELAYGWTLTRPDGTVTEDISLPTIVQAEEGSKFRISNTLPSDIKEGMHMCIRSVRQDITIYIDGEQRVYYGKNGFEVKHKSAISALVLIDLRNEDAGKRIDIDIEPNSFGSGKISEVTYAYGNNVWFPYIKDNLVLVMTAIITTIAGLASIIVYFFVRRRVKSPKALLYLAQLMVVTGLWVLCESPIRQLIFLSPSRTNVFSFILVSILAPFGGMFFNEIQGRKYGLVYMIIGGLALVQLSINSIFNFTGIADYYDTLSYIHIWSGLMMAWVFISTIRDIASGRIKEYKIASIGMLVIVAAVFMEIYRFYQGSVRTTGVYVGFGLLVMLACTILQLATNTLRDMDDRRVQMEKMTQSTFTTIASTLDAKDEYTGEHSTRVGQYARMIADKVALRYGFDLSDLDRIEYIGKMHDIGKIGVPDRVLNKNDKLTDAEFELMKKHTVVGDSILTDIDNVPGLREGVRHHHERWDGKGYPDGLKGTEIPTIARILCLADCYDAMTSDRIYRKRLPKEKVFEEIENNKGTQFDPELAEVVLRMMRNGELEG